MVTGNTERAAGGSGGAEVGCLVCSIGEKQQERKSFGFFGGTYLRKKGAR